MIVHRPNIGHIRGWDRFPPISKSATDECHKRQTRSDRCLGPATLSYAIDFCHPTASFYYSPLKKVTSYAVLASLLTYTIAYLDSPFIPPSIIPSEGTAAKTRVKGCLSWRGKVL